MNKRNYIITVNYNGWQDTIECMQSVLKNDYDNYQMIIIDNASVNNSVTEINHWIKNQVENPISYAMFENEDLFYKSNNLLEQKILIVKAKENGGFSSGNNIALRYIMRHDSDCFVWLLNPDMVIEKNSLTELNCCANLKKSRIFGTIHKDYNNPSKTILYGGWKVFPKMGIVRPIISDRNTMNIDFISGGSLFTHIKNFIEVGLLPEEYFLYWEEADWCEKAKRMGKILNVCDKSICYDKGSTSIGSNSKLAEYLYCYNSLVYSKKYYKNSLTVVFFLSLKGIKRFIFSNKNTGIVFGAIVDFYKGKRKYGNKKD